VGCTGCHTLAAVGSNGGIDLDDLKPRLPVAIDNITNGNAVGMPAWAGQLTKTQIQNLAASSTAPRTRARPAAEARGSVRRLTTTLRP